MEYLDICDEKGSPTGETVSREMAHRDGVLHRTAHVWVIRRNADGYEILLQKRSMDKDSFPGQYDTSSAGHIPAGEEPLPSALRELREELGIEAQPSELTFAGMFRIQYEKEFHGKPFRDNEVAWVYIYQEPVQTDGLTLQASEVDEVRWFDLEEVCREIQVSRERFCVPSGGLKVLKDFLVSEQDRGCGKAQDRKTLHVVAAVIRRGDQVFATQRGYGNYKDWWEFPGGKVEAGETPEQALVREIREELDADISVDRYLTTVEYDYPEFHLSMACYWCSLVGGHLTLLEHEAARWLNLHQLNQVNWLPADVLAVKAIAAAL